MKKIYKYSLKAEDEQTIYLPAGFEILSIQEQWDKLQMWVLVYPNAIVVPRKFRIFGTNQPLHGTNLAGYKYVNTVILTEVNLVCHVYIEDK